MVQPSHLKEILEKGYYTETIYRDVLEKLKVHGVESEHKTMESAIEEINKNKEKLKNTRLTILPVISIDWDGEVY